MALKAEHVRELVALVGGNWQGEPEAHGASFLYHHAPIPGSALHEQHLRHYRPVEDQEAGQSDLAVYPSSTEQVAAILAYCTRHRIPVFTQGGNTGLVGASVPDASGNGIVLSTRRMARILTPIGPGTASVRVEAGVIVDQLDLAAREHGLCCSIKHGGTGSATAGGSAATNAGGANAVRHGVTRDQVMGLRVATPLGQDLRLGGTLKDTSLPIDLKHLFIGSAGSLGVITEVELKLHPLPATVETALVGLSHYQEVHGLLGEMRRAFPGAIEAFEFMDSAIFHLSAAITENGASVIEGLNGANYVALLEVSSGMTGDLLLQERLFNLLQDQPTVLVAMDPGQRALFWRIREHGNPASKEFCKGRGVFFDNCVPVDQVGPSMEAIGQWLAKEFPSETADGRLRAFHFGHCADGNVHTHVVQDGGLPDNGFDISLHTRRIDEAITRLIVTEFGGNPAAEHNIGQKTWRLRDMDPQALDLVARLKAVLDPAGIMNPGRGLAG
jgi:FAD/FMN-containing dehydrogenase